MQTPNRSTQQLCWPARDALGELVRLLARQAAREWIASGRDTDLPQTAPSDEELPR
jgi:hypothetical protein